VIVCCGEVARAVACYPCTVIGGKSLPVFGRILFLVILFVFVFYVSYISYCQSLSMGFSDITILFLGLVLLGSTFSYLVVELNV